MKICEKHWAMMRKAVDDRGLSQFIKSAEEHAESMVREINEGEKPIFDPLMAMQWMVTNRALEAGGLYLLGHDENGNDYCPICEAMKHPCECGQPDCNSANPEMIELWWVDGPADVQVNKAIGLGLIHQS